MVDFSGQHNPPLTGCDGKSLSEKNNNIPESDTESISDNIELSQRNGVPHLVLVNEEDDASRVGTRLRMAREALGLTLEDISRESLIRCEYLDALEQMNPNYIPSGYLNGYLRTYARLVKLDPEQLVQRFNEECNSTQNAPPVTRTNRTTSHIPIGKAVLSLIILTLITSASFFWWQNRLYPSQDYGTVGTTAINDARRSLFDQSNIVLPDTVSEELTIIALSKAWLEVRGADGTIFISRELEIGESYIPRTGAGWTVHAKNGAAFEWRLGDKLVGKLSDEPVQVYALRIDNVLADILNTTYPSSK